MKRSKGTQLPLDASRYAREQVAMKEYVKLLNEDTGEWRLPQRTAARGRTRNAR